jgi:hypothetical protein
MKTTQLGSVMKPSLKRYAPALLTVWTLVSFGGTYCMHESGMPVYYTPVPPCPSGKDGTGMCFKWITFNNDYGFGSCVPSSDDELQCSDGTYTVRVQELVGMCNPNNCIMANPQAVNYDGLQTGSFSISSTPCSTGY